MSAGSHRRPIEVLSLEEALEQAWDALYEVQLQFLRGSRPPQETHDAIWSHVAVVLGVLAVLQDETPQSIAEQACPTNAEWREMLLPRIRAAARGESPVDG